jgi:hypothetical protein
MSHLKKSAKRTTRSKAAPVLGVAGITFLAGASAALAHASLDPATDNASNKIGLGEEEISDVSLATFYAVDHDGQGQSRGGTRRIRLAMGACGCGCGCGGCGGCWGGDYFGYGGYGPPPVFRDGYWAPAPVRPVQNYRRTYKRTDNR